MGGDALDECRRRVQVNTCGHRGRKADPLYAARRTLHTGAELLTAKQKTRLEALFKADEHVEVQATWGIYQRMIAAYREPDRVRGRTLMQQLIDSITTGVPAALTEVTKLGRTLAKRAADILAYFDRTGTSNVWAPHCTSWDRSGSFGVGRGRGRAVGVIVAQDTDSFGVVGLMGVEQQGAAAVGAAAGQQSVAVPAFYRFWCDAELFGDFVDGEPGFVA